MRRPVAHGRCISRDPRTGAAVSFGSPAGHVCGGGALGNVLGGSDPPPVEPWRHSSTPCHLVADCVSTGTRIGCGTCVPRAATCGREELAGGDAGAQTASDSGHLATLAALRVAASAGGDRQRGIGGTIPNERRTRPGWAQLRSPSGLGIVTLALTT
jgi:hypothetical protein